MTLMRYIQVRGFAYPAASKNHQESASMDIQWFPGHMAKAKRRLAENLKLVDIVIMTLDARAPLSTLNYDLDNILKDKKTLYVLNKSDLADEEATKEWIRSLKPKHLVLEFSSIKDNPDRLLNKINGAASEIRQKYGKKGVKKTIRAMVAGIPNVGKSALINALAGRKTLKEGNKPGVTRGLQWVKLSSYLELMDTPGVLPPKLSDKETALKVAALGSIKEEILNTEEIAVFLIETLDKIKPQAVKNRFDVETNNIKPIEVLESICKKRGFLVQKGEYDLERAALTLLDEFQKGKLGRISLERP